MMDFSCQKLNYPSTELHYTDNKKTHHHRMLSKRTRLDKSQFNRTSPVNS